MADETINYDARAIIQKCNETLTHNKMTLMCNVSRDSFYRWKKTGRAKAIKIKPLVDYLKLTIQNDTLSGAETMGKEIDKDGLTKEQKDKLIVDIVMARNYQRTQEASSFSYERAQVLDSVLLAINGDFTKLLRYADPDRPKEEVTDSCTFDKAQPHKQLLFKPTIAGSGEKLTTPCPVYPKKYIGSLDCQQGCMCGGIDIVKGILYCQHPTMV